MNPWDFLILQPMTNALLLLYQLLFNNFTLSILVFTILIRVITYPLTLQQQKSSKAMLDMQQSPEWKKMQEKYAKEKEKLAQEQMKMMQAAGVNPMGGCLPLVIQFPVLIGLYQALNLAMAASPLQMVELTNHIYKFLPNVSGLLPLDNHFLWLNLGLPDPFYILPIVVALSTWVQSKVMTPPSADPQAAQMSQSMAMTMPLMIGWFSLNVGAGLSLYWIISNVIGVAQYAITSPIKWKEVFSLNLSGPTQPEIAAPKKKIKRFDDD